VWPKRKRCEKIGKGERERKEERGERREGVLHSDGGRG
jgi:hypothetical protein